jgi:peroxiredoxin Q/BCP
VVHNVATVAIPIIVTYRNVSSTPGSDLTLKRRRGMGENMRHSWLRCCVAALTLSAAACQTKTEPADKAEPQTVTHPVKPAPAEAAKEGQSATAPSQAQADDKSAGAPTGAAAAPAELKEGDDAPNVTLTLQDGKQVPLSSLKGQQVALYFYPKDDTPGCTIEAQGIRDSWGELQKAKVHVYGVSLQDAASHQAFIDKHKLPFDLVVDGDKSVTKAFGVPSNGEYASRQTFLIGADGKIKKVWRNVNPGEHAKQLLEAAGQST